jgi:hypothetical protein
MSKKEVLFELLDDDSRRILEILEDSDPESLHWSPDGEGNTIAVTVWHVARILDVFLTQHIRNEPADAELWFQAGWADQSGYDPRGLGTRGWGAVTGYTGEQVRQIPQMDKHVLQGYYKEITAEIRNYLESTTDEVLEEPSKGFEGRRSNYVWIRHSLFDLTRHVGEMMAINAMWNRQQGA